MIDGLVQFVTERLDDDQRIAEACQAEVGTTRKGEMHDDGSGLADRDDYPSYPWGSRDAELAFMAHFDPARALREVEAKRAMLRFLDPTGAPDGEGRYVAERAIFLLAMTWSDHPDYRPEWSPS